MDHKSIRNLYYQLAFNDVVRNVRSSLDSNSSTPDLDLQLIAINALHEMYDLEEQAAWMQRLRQQLSHADSDPVMAFYLGRLAYLNRDFVTSHALFNQAYTDIPERLRAKTLIGFGNAKLSLGDDNLLPILEQLKSLLPEASPDERIAAEILFAHVQCKIHRNYDAASDHYYSVLSQATVHSWPYFQIHGIYGLAILAKSREQLSELNTYVSLLDRMLASTNANYFRFLINQQFSDEELGVTELMSFNKETFSATIGDRVFDLLDKPLLFDFLSFLGQKGTFLTKESIADHLWPESPYNPDVHDTRIFDLVKRARRLIEKSHRCPQYLISNRRGYRLAVR